MTSTDLQPRSRLDYGDDLRSLQHALRVEVDLFRLPATLERVNQLLTAGPVDLRRLGETMAEAPDLAADTLRLCNSSLFGLSQPVASLEQAVIVVDAEMVLSLLLCCWLVRYSGEHAAARENWRFWRHSLLVAQLSRRIGEWTDCAQPERVFLAGLLHDAGTLPFLSFYSRNGARCGGGIFEDVGDSIDLQRQRFGVDHCELGLKLSSILGFPVSIVETAGRHHQRGPALGGAPPVCFVSAAERIAQCWNAREAAGEPLPSLIRSSLAEYLPQLAGAALSRLAEAIEADLQAASQPAALAAEFWSASFDSPGAEEIGAERRESVESH